MTPSILELGYLGFEVSDRERWKRFASEVIGADVADGPCSTTRLKIDDAPARFILSYGPANDLSYAGWRVESASDVDAFSKHLKVHGVSHHWASDDDLEIRGVLRALQFRDPEGNWHEVYAAQPKASSPLQSKLVSSGFVTGNGGAGHVVFEADDYPRMIEFANKILGVKLSDNIYLQPAPGVKIEVSFFHANERHHSIAVAPRAPVPGPKKRIHHFMVEVGQVADVGRARDRCLSFGLPVVMDIGQHPNDQMISFYAHTPSGFLVEVGWGGVKVDEESWKAQAFDRVSNWGHRPFGALPGEGGGVPAAAVEVA
ncbi:MAG: VOC family protein [Hydrogenophaga sp.]|nr:VOC family protein [Hydrogenophaga sp.]